MEDVPICQQGITVVDEAAENAAEPSQAEFDGYQPPKVAPQWLLMGYDPSNTLNDQTGNC
jgi:hypothetical protein